MSATLDAGAGEGARRPDSDIDKDRLDHWMTANVPGYRGPLRIERFKGGQSNPTYRLVTPAASYVLRRRPAGTLLRGAHDLDREVRVMTAVATVGYPVPRIYGQCHDDAVIGTGFYVMEMIEGRIFWDATLPDIEPSERPRYYDAMNKALARLHSIDVERIGLGDFGRPGNYFARQIGRWSAQYREDGLAGRSDAMDRLIEWLRENIPPGEEAAIVHGDFRVDNLVFDPVEPRIVAVLDWELSTLGHPLADFAYHAMMYHTPPDIVAGLADADLRGLNIPSRSDYIGAYLRQTGREGAVDFNFYLAFNFFRLAAIFHGIKARAIRGNASSADATGRDSAFERLAEIGCTFAADA